jgi:hypothetical protein
MKDELEEGRDDETRAKKSGFRLLGGEGWKS